jgi:hypothetical protein
MNKPKINTWNIEVLDILQALKYIESQGHKGFKHNVWDRWCDEGVIPGNDCIIEYHFDKEDEDDALIQKTFDLKDSAYFNVSW